MTENFKPAIDVSWTSVAGIKSENEDSAAAFTPAAESYLRNSKGVSLLVADGVSSAEAGKQASEAASSRFIEEYYKTPDTWSVSHSGEKILSTINLKLFRNSLEFSSTGKGHLCTFSSIIIKGHVAHYFHVGDSRIYLLRNNENQELVLKQITRDHIVFLSNGSSYLSRALGMDNKLNIDYGKIVLEQGDVLLISTDGLHDFIPHEALITLLKQNKEASEICQQLVEVALENNSDDNISCAIAKINALPKENANDLNTKLTRLPFPPDLQEGMKIDGYRVIKEIFASSRSQLYLVADENDNNRRYIMKTPSINFEDDREYIDRFIQEEWIGGRIDSPHAVKIITQKRNRTALYYLMEFVEGVSLDKWMELNRLPQPKRAIDIVKQIAKGLKAFHDNEAIHQDLKPANIIISADGHVTIIDFGSVHVAGIAELFHNKEEEALGTATYSDPHSILGASSGIQGDLYSLAVITYEIFTGSLPYGEKIEKCRTIFDFERLRYTPGSAYNSIIPVWFDKALAKGCAIDLEERYKTIPDFMADLTQPNPTFLKDEMPTERQASRLMFWKIMSGFWLVLFLLVVYLFNSL